MGETRCLRSGCVSEPKVRGMCRTHYTQYWRTGSVYPIKRDDHGLSMTAEYGVFKSMRARCLNPNNKSFRRYGGQGVKICDRWTGVAGFRNFLKDMGERPSAEHSIDRIDVYGDYEPSNCRWATMNEQNDNKKNTLHVKHDGRTLTPRQWSVETGIPRKTIYDRIFLRGWDIASALDPLAVRKLSRKKEVEI